ncbi:MAG: pilus assembly protein PilP [Thermochromatium sp.]
MITARRLWLATALLLVGCGSHDIDDLETYVRQVNARPPGPIESLPEIKPIETFVYEPGERRDPFQSDVQSEPEPEVTESGPAPDLNRPREELESYPLDSLRMVGTLEQNDMRWALVRTKEGIVHLVTVGNYLGQNHGRIVAIDLDAIQLNEIVSDAPGQWRERTTTMALSQ